MTKYQQEQHDFVKKMNLASLSVGGNSMGFAYCFFFHDDGIYYDPVGDEIFEVTRIGGTDARPEYVIDFGDEVKAGAIKDHGLHEFLGKGDFKVIDIRRSK